MIKETNPHNTIEKKRYSIVAKKLIAYIIFNLLFVCSYAQVVNSDHFAKRRIPKHEKAPDNKSTEFGVLLGASQYNGETNLAGQFNPQLLGPSVGLLIRRNLNSRWALRLNGMWGKLKGNDLLGNTNIQSRRGLAFNGNFLELSGQAEFNFIPFCACDNNQYITPYAFVGIGAGRYAATTTYVGGSDGDLGSDANSGSAFAANLPFGIGARYKFSHRFLASLEWGFRKAFTDYLDNISTVYASTGTQIGNSKNNDFYSIAGITLTIRLGPQMTTCVFGQ